MLSRGGGSVCDGLAASVALPRVVGLLLKALALIPIVATFPLSLVPVAWMPPWALALAPELECELQEGIPMAMPLLSGRPGAPRQGQDLLGYARSVGWRAAPGAFANEVNWS